MVRRIAGSGLRVSGIIWGGGGTYSPARMLKMGLPKQAAAAMAGYPALVIPTFVTKSAHRQREYGAG